MADRWFASDNNAETHPRVMEALAGANSGHAVAYGDDPLTARAEAAVAALFGSEATVRFVLNGTGANVYALGCLAGQGDAILCSDCAHILVDETGAPGAVTGAQLVPLHSDQGKVGVHALVETLRNYDDLHKPRPRVLSLSQPTEVGTVYTMAELAGLCQVAHEAGLFVHIDGARLSNAAVALDSGPAGAAGYILPAAAGQPGKPNQPGADAVSFGGTKNGLMFGEAVVFAPAVARVVDTARLRKTRLQLSSKMRYIAAQFEAYVKDGLWKDCATHANKMARRLAEGLAARGIRPLYPVQTNAVFVKLPGCLVEELRSRRFFYDWEGGAVRLMTSWDTDDTDVDGFLAELDAALAAHATRDPGKPLVQPGHNREDLLAARAVLRSNWDSLERYPSDESLGVAPPPFTQAAPQDAPLVALPDPASLGLGSKSFHDVTAQRRSRRRYKPEAISLAELSFLLWASAGVKTIRGPNAFRTVPSGGCRHPLDLFIYARRVEGLAPGLYRHMATDRSLALVRAASPVPGADPDATGYLNLDAELDEGLSGQLWNCAAMFIWTAVPYRTEWRYTAAAVKTILIDAGHACQALYGAATALELGTCAQAAYHQEKLDKALGVDGIDEFAVLAAPVGRIA